MHYQQMRGGVKKRQGGHHCKLLEPLHDSHITFVDIHLHTTNESTEAIRNKGGVKVGECRHRCKVFQGGEVDGFVQGSLEHPRNTSQVQNNCFLVQTMRLREEGVQDTAIHCPTKRDQHPSYRSPDVTGIDDHRDGYKEGVGCGVDDVGHRVQGPAQRRLPLDEQVTARGIPYEARGLGENRVGIVDETADDIAEDASNRSLIWAALGNRARNDDENIEDDA